MSDTVNQSKLGEKTAYCSHYDATLLFPIPRQDKRDELGIDDKRLPFQGLDVWTAFEVSWLNSKGKPVVRLAEFAFGADSRFIIESKSFKLYLNSFNGTHFDNEEAVLKVLKSDLSEASGDFVGVQFRSIDCNEELVGNLPGLNLDELDIEVADYQVDTSLLTADQSFYVSETLNSHLLKSNCLVTGQPDWGSLVVRYEGPRINHSQLLKYIISFRNHNEFHEQCVERIFMDLMTYCQPENLTVYARYVRRGGLDINPYRSNFEDEFDISRTVRQ